MIEAMGAVGGFVGSLVNRGFDFWTKKEERKHEIALMKEQRETSKLLHSQQLDLETWKGLATSLEHDKSIQGNSPWVQDVRAMVRPALTIALVAAGVATGESEITTLASIAVGWWFGDRSASKVRGALPAI